MFEITEILSYPLSNTTCTASKNIKNNKETIAT